MIIRNEEKIKISNIDFIIFNCKKNYKLKAGKIKNYESSKNKRREIADIND